MFFMFAPKHWLKVSFPKYKHKSAVEVFYSSGPVSRYYWLVPLSWGLVSSVLFGIVPILYKKVLFVDFVILA